MLSNISMKGCQFRGNKSPLFLVFGLLLLANVSVPANTDCPQLLVDARGCNCRINCGHNGDSRPFDGQCFPLLLTSGVGKMAKLGNRYQSIATIDECAKNNAILANAKSPQLFLRDAKGSGKMDEFKEGMAEGAFIADYGTLWVVIDAADAADLNKDGDHCRLEILNVDQLAKNGTQSMAVTMQSTGSTIPERSNVSFETNFTTNQGWLLRGNVNQGWKEISIVLYEHAAGGDGGESEGNGTSKALLNMTANRNDNKMYLEWLKEEAGLTKEKGEKDITGLINDQLDLHIQLDPFKLIITLDDRILDEIPLDHDPIVDAVKVEGNIDGTTLKSYLIKHKMPYTGELNMNEIKGTEFEITIEGKIKKGPGVEEEISFYVYTADTFTNFADCLNPETIETVKCEIYLHIHFDLRKNITSLSRMDRSRKLQEKKTYSNSIVAPGNIFKLGIIAVNITHCKVIMEGTLETEPFETILGFADQIYLEGGILLFGEPTVGVPQKKIV